MLFMTSEQYKILNNAACSRADGRSELHRKSILASTLHNPSAPKPAEKDAPNKHNTNRWLTRCHLAFTVQANGV